MGAALSSLSGSVHPTSSSFTYLSFGYLDPVEQGGRDCFKENGLPFGSPFITYSSSTFAEGCRRRSTYKYDATTGRFLGRNEPLESFPPACKRVLQWSTWAMIAMLRRSERRPWRRIVGASGFDAAAGSPGHGTRVQASDEIVFRWSSRKFGLPWTIGRRKAALWRSQSKSLPPSALLRSDRK